MEKSRSRLTKTEKEFLKFVRAECRKHKINCVLRNSEYLRLSKNIKCSGYFDELGRTLAVATKRGDWLEILVHEYCHLTQWVDNCKEWKRADQYNSCALVDEWLSGKTVKNPYFHLSLMRDLELDNEKRSVNLIKEFGLEKTIDLDNYIRKANAYVSFYNYMKYTRKWTDPENSPYTNKTLIEAMPKTFRMNHKKLSKKLYAAFVKSGV